MRPVRARAHRESARRESARRESARRESASACVTRTRRPTESLGLAGLFVHIDLSTDHGTAEVRGGEEGGQVSVGEVMG